MPLPAATEGASISTGSLKPESLKVMVTVNLVPSGMVMSPNPWEPAAFCDVAVLSNSEHRAHGDPDTHVACRGPTHNAYSVKDLKGDRRSPFENS